MRKFKMIAKLYRIVKSGSSMYGNPHYSFILEDKDGKQYNAKTTPDANCAYAIHNWGEGENASFAEWDYHYSRNGNLIVDYIRQINNA